MNLIDGLDGLAGGVALVAVVTTFLVSLQRGHPLMMLFSSALAGSIVGFLFYNFNPASIFMGDTGSMFLGFILATTAMETNQKSSTAVAVLIPGIALGLPIMDTLLAIGRRAIRGRPLFQPDKEHIHHKLMDLGLTPPAVGAGALRVLHPAGRGRDGADLLEQPPGGASPGRAHAGGVLLPALARATCASTGIQDSAVDRRRNRAMRAALQPLGRRLRQLRAPAEMWPVIVEAATALGAVAVTLQADSPATAETPLPVFSHGPADGEVSIPLFRFRFAVPGGKGAGEDAGAGVVGRPHRDRPRHRDRRRDLLRAPRRSPGPRRRCRALQRPRPDRRPARVKQPARTLRFTPPRRSAPGSRTAPRSRAAAGREPAGSPGRTRT